MAGRLQPCTQFCELYVIANEKNVTIAEIWDGNELKISFRRRVSNRLMLSWLDLVSIAESITFTDDCDAICWAFDGSGKFSVQSMYRTIVSEVFYQHTHLLFGSFSCHQDYIFSFGCYLTTRP